MKPTSVQAGSAPVKKAQTLAKGARSKPHRSLHMKKQSKKEPSLKPAEAATPASILTLEIERAEVEKRTFKSGRKILTFPAKVVVRVETPASKTGAKPKVERLELTTEALAVAYNRDVSVARNAEYAASKAKKALLKEELRKKQLAEAALAKKEMKVAPGLRTEDLSTLRGGKLVLLKDSALGQLQAGIIAGLDFTKRKDKKKGTQYFVSSVSCIVLSSWNAQLRTAPIRNRIKASSIVSVLPYSLSQIQEQRIRPPLGLFKLSRWNNYLKAVNVDSPSQPQSQVGG